jgi:hypothetical protein
VSRSEKGFEIHYWIHGAQVGSSEVRERFLPRYYPGKYLDLHNSPEMEYPVNQHGGSNG